MALAVKKVLFGKRTKDGSLKYENLLCDKEMKISHEMTEWLDF